MNRRLIYLLIFCFSTPAFAQELSVSIDMASAEKICQLLSQKKADTIELKKAAGLYGNQLLIKKVKGYSGAGEDVFINTLKEIIETGTIKGRDEYNWKLVKEKLPEINQLLNYIRSNNRVFIEEVKAIIQPYLPKELKAAAKACFLAGGGSLGFTIGNDPSFNVALQKIGDDIKGLQYLVAHELYHSLQDIGQSSRVYQKDDKKITYPEKATYYLLYNLWAEGIANFVGDMAAIKDLKEFSKEQAGQYQKNRARRYQNFQLLEALLYRQYHDSTANYQATYDIGFSTAFDETSYFVGYEMAKKIAQHQGNEAIAALLVKDPIRFIADYIALYQKLADDQSFVRFSRSTEEIVSRLLAWENKL
ncbi:DUF5700 domain-containing putative Zn-dependent protease [Flavihumibacter sp. CACIAM 22H1]|uniref:DUF5700 domain-containing putative Zn-dependent protease n=1 Tax=Flavihumibacter sp. CACIAM 22H1 TaxID=1812911 RepID=UPI0025C184E8|nr:DUF5700 domain-containing putative Zn-dependent protease [Flavihumibacter sp. CACIAM 22H1]